MMRAAVIGVNFIGKMHCQHYTSHPDTELVAICDLKREMAEEAAEPYGAKVYTSVAEMLQHENLDIVSVATGGFENGSHHLEPTMQVIQAGIPVLVEKPLSNDLNEAREMVEAARQKKVLLACNLNHRFVPPAITAKQWVNDGDVGHLMWLNMQLTIGNPNESSPWLHLRALHPHSIDVMQYLAGPISEVQSFLTKAPGRNTWSTASLNMRFESGAVGHLTGSYDVPGSHPIERCEIGGTKGRIVLDNVYESLTLYPGDSETLRVVRNSIMSGVASFLDTFKLRIHRWIDQVREGVSASDLEGSGEEAYQVQRVIEAAIRSHELGGLPVRVADVEG